jgi:hypothetical protein
VEGDGRGLTNAVKKIALYSSGGRRQIDCLCAKRVVRGCRGEEGRGMGGGGMGECSQVEDSWETSAKFVPDRWKFFRFHFALN